MMLTHPVATPWKTLIRFAMTKYCAPQSAPGVNSTLSSETSAIQAAYPPRLSGRRT